MRVSQETYEKFIEQAIKKNKYKNKKLIQKNKKLEEEIKLLKKYSNNSDLKEIIIKEIVRHKECDIK